MQVVPHCPNETLSYRRYRSEWLVAEMRKSSPHGFVDNFTRAMKKEKPFFN
tara:strand:- start:37 stop:189 length:153 start_codon:yes stop_codon:yes gene_type:complete